MPSHEQIVSSRERKRSKADQVGVRQSPPKPISILPSGNTKEGRAPGTVLLDYPYEFLHTAIAEITEDPDVGGAAIVLDEQGALPVGPVQAFGGPSWLSMDPLHAEQCRSSQRGSTARHVAARAAGQGASSAGLAAA